MSQSKSKPAALLDATRLRGRPSRPFCWVDPRLIKDGHINACQSSHALGLYLILVIVGNQHGVSYYGDQSLSRWLKIERYQLHHARGNLVDAGLIAYNKPYYQVLRLGDPDLPDEAPPKPTTREPKATAPVHRDDLPEDQRREIVSMLRNLRAEIGRRSHFRED